MDPAPFSRHRSPGDVPIEALEPIPTRPERVDRPSASSDGDRSAESVGDDRPARRPVATDGGTADGAVGPPFDPVADRETLLERIAALIDGADDEVALSIPSADLEAVEENLRAAVERGALVVLLVGGDDDLSADRFEGIASVARVWSRETPVVATADYARGLMAPTALLRASEEAVYGLEIAERPLVFVLNCAYFGAFWRIATQLYATVPDSLPEAYENIRHAAFQAALHLEAGDAVAVSARARPFGAEEVTSVEGQLVDVRQSLLEPLEETFAVENALIVERADGERVTLGGENAFVEEYRMESVTLETLA